VTRRALVALMAAGLLACREKPAEEVTTEEAVAVEVEAARVGPIHAVITATGTVEPAPGADFTVTAPGPAKIAEMPRAEGDRVRRGDLLVRFDAPALDADAAARAAELGQARANLDNAKKNHARLSGLLAKGIAAKKEVEDARKELLDAEAALRGATSTAANAAELAGRAVVRARFAGVVAKRTHNPGDTVDASTGDPVLRVIDPSRLQVSVAVPVGDLGRIVVGRAARLVVSGGPQPPEGRVLSLPAAVDTATGTATVRISAPPGLAVGTPVQVEIVAEEKASAVLVPAAAIVREDDKTAVFVVGADGKAHRRAVVVGIANQEAAEIESGVAAGEKVVVKGQEELPDGAAVTVGE
jgi:RND family efflux transporter MFP subunit